ncbi:hypothetical protein Poli38472_014229 [Pythium oligandrum]|uniref:Amino acid transporter transmembrane domain-containing protein n=1 Tax=Pythium oligandrum TaxID=41045 RepID=A0A8K1FLR7_PYTOL|nr:hypothetical protein Poli38472_014229 [Pythium oligandrum]|eukprot:TMW64112.1 hypothetical protein Poli38472_014229 [Pythium oligandrum]
MAGKKPFLTGEDLKIAFNLFCCVYGIGTLGMPANFSRSGPVIAVIALLFMACANVYSSVVISKLMLIAPRSVRTFGDLGEWSMGKTGRWLVVIAQMAVCILTPCAFLVLGGTLLDGLFPGAFESWVWIILMAVLCVPVCLTPTLKEGAGAALAGCIGTLVGDIIGVALLMHGMSGHGTIPKPDIKLEQVAMMFGNLSLAYGAGVVIPALQRQHSEPTRMPRVVFVTLTFISVLFLILASTGYSAVGCQISGNLLFTIYSNPSNPLTKLGFTSDWGAVVIAYLGMQTHITIAFSVLLHPSFFIVERLFLGMHKRKPEDLEALYHAADTPATGEDKLRLSSKGSVVSMADVENDHETEEEESEAYRGQAHKYIPARLVIIAICVVASVLLRDHFLDLSDFVGASAITLSCIILPIIFYLKKMWTTVPLYEKIPGLIIVLVCLVLGVYVTIKTGKNLFNPDEVAPDAPKFAFCKAENQYEVYYNSTAAALGN